VYILGYFCVCRFLFVQMCTHFVLTCGYFGKKMGDPHRYVRASIYPGATWVHIFVYLNI